MTFFAALGLLDAPQFPILRMAMQPRNSEVSSKRPLLSARQKLMLHVLSRKSGATVVQITDLLKPFFPPERPTSQLSVREDLKALLAFGLVAIAHTGKPRTYVRTPQSFRLAPASWKPASHVPATTSATSS